MILWLACAEPVVEPEVADTPELHDVVFSEELLLALVPELRHFEEMLLRGQGFAAHPELFAARVTVTDPVPAGIVPLLPHHGVTRITLAPSEPAVAEGPLVALLGRRTVERAEVKLKRLDFPEGDRERMTALLALDVVATGVQRLWIHGAVEADWVLGEGGWRIHALRNGDLLAEAAPATLFREALDTLVPDAELRASLRASTHEQHVVRYLAEGVRPGPHFELESFDRHPAVSVVDLDGDGQDAIYVMARWERAVLLERGPAGWVDVAPELGLDLEGPLSGALFEDFDQDGDTDAFIARPLAPSLMLWREGDRFVSEEVGPALATSAAAADVDGDGLLDIYVATYAASLIERVFELDEHGSVDPMELLGRFLPAATAEELVARIGAQSQVYLDRAGPPDVLLRNAGGGRFVAEPQDDWRNTYQAGFSDVDGDGDPDLYLAHDFAPNRLLENRDGELVDITEATGTADFGFGMGVSFGDVDADGRDDLYVSNMYSSAGARITAQLPGLDPRMAKGASGNSLLLGRGLSAWTRSDAPVSAAGWSWGGQIVDLDLDGQQDLYVPNGYYTAPPSVAIEHDT